MRSSILRSLALTVIALFVLAGCGGDDGGSGSDSGSGSGSGSASAPAEDEFDQEAFCEAAGDFGTAQSGAPDASTPEEVEERLTAMSDAADAIVETAPEDVTEDAQAFADAIADFEQYGEDRDYEVDLGGGAPEYQSGEGATIGENITNTIAAVDQAVQDECGRFLSEAA